SRAVRRTWRLRITGRGRSRRSGRGVSRPAEKSEPHSRIKSHQPGSVGEQSAFETLSPRSRSSGTFGTSRYRSDSRSGRARWLVLLQYEVYRGRPTRRGSETRTHADPARGGINRQG